LGIAPGRAWLDVGAGTGVLSRVILQEAHPARVLGVDLSPEYIEFARQRIRDDRVGFWIADAADVAADPPQFDVSVAGLVLNFLPAPRQAVESMTQAVKDGGTIPVYVWDYGGQMEMMRQFWQAAIAIDPAAREMDSGRRFTICKPDSLSALFQSVDLRAI